MNSRIYKWTFWLLAAFAGLHWLGTRWGATDAEVDANLPGDDVIPHPNFETTHAVSVAAPPATIWPWIAQGGYGRGGWYSESWLDPIIIGALVVMTPAGKPKPTRPPRSADTILPAYQHPSVGDIIPDGPPDTAWFRVMSVDPDHSYVLHSTTHVTYLTPTTLQSSRWALKGDFTWVFALQPAAGGGTRLLLRTRASAQPRAVLKLMYPLLLAGDFAQARAILNGIKQRAESATGRA
jgi:hypothetical protein